MPGTSVFLSRETGMSGNFVGLIKAAKYPFDFQDGTWAFSGDAVAGKGFIFRSWGNHVVFLELRWDSRFTTGNSGCLWCWTREVQSFIRGGRENWRLLSCHCRANSPHLGLCPEANVPLQRRQGSLGCIPDSPGESGLVSSGSKELRFPLESGRVSFGAP